MIRFPFFSSLILSLLAVPFTICRDPKINFQKTEQSKFGYHISSPLFNSSMFAKVLSFLRMFSLSIWFIDCFFLILILIIQHFNYTADVIRYKPIHNEHGFYLSRAIYAIFEISLCNLFSTLIRQSALKGPVIVPILISLLNDKASKLPSLPDKDPSNT